MQTLTPVSACRHTTTIHVTTTQATQFIDLTDRLERLVADADLRFGIVNVQTLHTTTAIIVNEHEPLAAGRLPGPSRSGCARRTADTSTTTRTPER